MFKSIVLIILIVAMVSVLWSGAPSAGTGQASDLASIIRGIDDLYRSSASYAEVEMEIATASWKRTLSLRGWTKGQDRMFIRILAPKKEAGVGTLRIGSEMWNYLPKTDKVIKIPPSMMMSSWMGSDFTNDDLVREFTLADDYDCRFVPLEPAEAGLLGVEARPKPGRPILWGRVLIAVRAADGLPVWQRFYDEKNTAVRLLRYGDIRTFGARTIPSVMEMIPLTKNGAMTVVRYLKIEFDRPAEAGIFSLRHLQSQK
jgi:outer membrane lipoprotein-sorting protein